MKFNKDNLPPEKRHIWDLSGKLREILRVRSVGFSTDAVNYAVDVLRKVSRPSDQWLKLPNLGKLAGALDCLQNERAAMGHYWAYVSPTDLQMAALELGYAVRRNGDVQMELLLSADIKGLAGLDALEDLLDPPGAAQRAIDRAIRRSQPFDGDRARGVPAE